MRNIAAWMLLIVLLFTTATADVNALPQGVQVTPYLQEVILQASEQNKEFKVTITNLTKAKQLFKLSAIDFSASNENGGVSFGGEQNTTYSSKFGLAKWLSFDRTELALEPGAKTDISTTIKNDDNLRPGGHYGAVLTTIDSSEVSGPNSVGTKQSVSALVFVRKVGGEKYDIRLDEATHNGSIFKLTNKIKLRFYNPGNVHIIPRGIVKIIRNSDKKIIAEGAINEDSNFILPETRRQIFVNVHATGVGELLLPETYSLVVEYRYEGIENVATRSFKLTYISPKSVLFSIFILAGMASVGLWYFRFKKAPPKQVKITKKPKLIDDIKR